jgi:hypothetical protein
MSRPICTQLLLRLITVVSVLTSSPTPAQTLYNKALSYEGYMGNLEPVSGPDGFLICSRVRFGTFDDIDGFQFTRIDSTGTVFQTSAFSTGSVTYSMQHGALARSRSNGSFSFLFGGFTALRIFNTTSAGSLNWNRMVRYVDPDYLIPYLGAMDQSFEETPDGGYLITALRKYPAGGVTDTLAPMLLKLDSTGEVLWKKTYDLGETSGWHITSHVDTTGTILFGFHADTPYAIVSDNNILTKIDPNGTTLWSKRVDEFNGRLTGSTMVAGRYVVSAADSSSIYILNMDTAGVPLWGRRYDMTFPLSTWGASIVPTLDNGFVLTTLMPDSVGNADVFFFKVDSVGTTQWERAYGNTNFESLVDLVQNGDSTFTMLTHTQIWDSSYRYYLSRLDDSGLNDCIVPANGVMSESTISFSMVDILLEEFAPPMISQPLYANDSLSYDPLMMDTCLFEVGIELLTRPNDLQVYPNPTIGIVTIRSATQLHGALFTITDMMGRQVSSIRMASTETIIDLGTLPNSIYLYHVVTPSGTTISGRLIKE